MRRRTHPAFSLFLFALTLALPALAEPPSKGAPVPAPRFDLPTRTGSVSSESLRGKVVYVDFWASWCEPCRKSFPWLASLQTRYAPKGLAVIAVNLDKKRDAADAFLAKYPAPFTVAFDPAGKTAGAFKVAAMPSSYLIGPDGNILFTHAGFDPKETAMIEARIQEACPQ
jgi:cytochrome c biogenesis protein CcmG/thiol:disulfide interchange protein DsbE